MSYAEQSASGLNVVALIPARAGSKRVQNKNVMPLGEHPVLAYTISAAIESRVFDAVVVSTDSSHYADVARYYGAQVPTLRPAEFAADLSPDIDWVEYTLLELKRAGQIFDCFSILRPTSPLRQAETIQRAWQNFLTAPGIDSLRAVEKCVQHPGKMWVVRGHRMLPLLPLAPAEQPWHSSQYPMLPEVYVQNGSLEIAWSRVVHNGRTIAGEVIIPFFTQGLEGFDINRPTDITLLQSYLKSGEAVLPNVSRPSYFTQGNA